jgi:acetoin utilization deacetylase AcuC-like enzyme
MPPTAPTTGYMRDAISRLHETGPDHPECPGRYDAVEQALAASGLADRLLPISARQAAEEEILLCHSRAYLSAVKQDVLREAPSLRTGDTAIGPHSLLAALSAAGGVIEAVDAVMAGRVRQAFCLVRPPGHHAGPETGMGFCIFNNVALGARWAQRRHGVERVLIVDWDVHHGNGTQDIFYEDGSVFYFSTHQSPWYPGTGAVSERGWGAGEGTTLNCPLPAGAGRREILGAFEQQLVPAMREFNPELILVSAGFDSRVDDPLGLFRLTDPDFVDLTRLMLELADTCCGGRLVSVLEGGYNIEGLMSATVAHVGALLGAAP